MSKALEIYNELNVEASHLDEGSNYNCVFGVGTNLTNDCGVKPLNIVMKLMRCNGKNLVKLSDNPGKTMGDEKVVEEVRSAYE